MKNIEETSFEYMEYHFMPYANIEKGLDLKHISSNDKIGFASHLGYSHSEFYKASNDSNKDLFKCIEDNHIYIPCGDRLYKYVGEI